MGFDIWALGEQREKCDSIFNLKRNLDKVRSSYGSLAYFSDIFISGKNVVFSVQNENAEYLENEKK